MLAQGVPHCYRFRVPKNQVVTIKVRSGTLALALRRTVLRCAVQCRRAGAVGFGRRCGAGGRQRKAAVSPCGPELSAAPA